MAEETNNTATPESQVVVPSDVPALDNPVTTLLDKEAPPHPDKSEEPAPQEVVEGEKEKDEASQDNKIAESASFKEESNKALNKHEFTAPPPAPPKDEEKKEEDPKPQDKKEDEEPKPEEKKDEEEPKPQEKKEEEPKTDAKTEAPAQEKKEEEPSETVVVDKVEEKVEAVEEIKETIVHEVAAPAPPPCEEPAAAQAEEEEKPKEADEETATPLAPEEEAFAMLKSVVAWRKEFKIDELLEEEGIGEGLEKVVYIHGLDKEGHPVCYNAFGEFQDKELYSNTFSDAEKRAKFLRWYIQFLEKNIRKLDFSPDGTCTIVQVTDLKNSPGLILFKKELRQATNQALQLLQDNYPEFVAKQVFINVPWWYVAYNRMISPFLTQRTKSKFVFAGPTRTAETLFKYIAPEQVPVQYGGLSKEGEHKFTTADAATEETIKPTSKHTIELPITEAGTLVWEVRVAGWDVSYGAEFVPSNEEGYTWIVQKSRKIGAADEQVVGCTFKIGEAGKVVLTFDNQTSKKKKLLYRSKTKPSE
ncbi:UNVERIFIED_CONTAM: Patellin-5 [Sesamum radiatum]|uniref:Patellin-5 n=1 Tax=Sesamum radiatum TaxID=300843 RepID=A0AAW2QD41_SESRA